MVKENYVLKHDLDDLDEKIRMLIKNKLSLEEVTTSVSHLLGDQQEQVRRRSTKSALSDSDCSSLVHAVLDADGDTGP
jgi:hypothetical protein